MVESSLGHCGAKPFGRLTAGAVVTHAANVTGYIQRVYGSYLPTRGFEPG